MKDYTRIAPMWAFVKLVEHLMGVYQITARK